MNSPIRIPTIDSVGTARKLDYICFPFLLLATVLKHTRTRRYDFTAKWKVTALSCSYRTAIIIIANKRFRCNNVMM